MKLKFYAFLAFLLVLTLNISNVCAQFYQDELLAGNATEDLLVWVTNYEPKLVRSDLLEESDVSIFAQLKGIQVNPFISIPVINTVSLQPTSVGKATNVIGLNYIKPKGTATTDDLGWIAVTIKRIPTEDKMPDVIEMNISAIIDYYFEDSIGFGTKDVSLDIVNEREWLDNEWKYEFWDNSGFLRLSDLTSDQRAVIELYDSAKNLVGRLTLANGQKSNPYLINVHGKRGYVTVTLNGIESPSPYARVLVNANGKKSENIVKVNSPLYSGSEWKVISVEPKSGGGGNLLIRNSKGEEKSLSIETRSIAVLEGNVESQRGIGEKIGDYYIGWITNNLVYLIKADNKDFALKSLRDLIKSKGTESLCENAKSRGITKDCQIVPQGGTVPGTGITIKTVLAPSYSAILDNPDAKKYLDSAIEQYNEISSGLDVGVRGDTKIPVIPNDMGYVYYNDSWPKSALWRAYEFLALNGYDQAKASEFLKKLIDKYPSDKDKDKWQAELDSLFSYNYANAQSFVVDKGTEISILLEEVSVPELSAKASLVVRGIQSEYNEGSIVGSDWYLEKVTEKDVTLRRADGMSYATIAAGTERELNISTGLKVKVLSTKVEKEARVTVAPFHRNGHTVTNFSLHVAVEKRGIQLSPEQINDQIKNADDQIKQLNKITASMANTISGMRNTCFATYTFLLVKKLFDWSGTTGKARNLVMRGVDGNSGWIKFCEDNITESRKLGVFKKSVEDCLWDNRKLIDNQLQVTKDALNSVKNDLGSYFDAKGEIKDSAGLKTKFPQDIQKFIESQEYLKNKFGTSQITRDDIEKIYLYQQLGTKGKDTLLGKEAEEKSKILLEGYTKDNGVVSTLQDEVPPASSVDYSNASSSEKQDRLDKWKLAHERVLLQEQQKKVSDRINAFRIDVDETDPTKGMAYAPSIDSKPVQVVKDTNTGEWIYTDSAGKKVTVIKQQECAGKQKVTVMEPYGSGKDKGRPARVPFSKGWAEVTDYDSNGNAKEMIVHVTTPLENGECPDLIYNSGQDLNVFVEADRKVIQSAARCVEGAITSVKTKQKSFVCEGRTVNQGDDYVPRAEQNYCEDFFSKSDCNVLYQVCDPVICPPSRCDLGGRFKVGNVIQSGVFGSILLCLPNFPTPLIAVCLPGLRAGLMGYQSMLQGYKSCLQKQLDTGETVGICDRIRSLYWCDLLWKTVFSIYDKLGGLSGILSSGVDKAKGGGEYLTANTGLQEAEKSLTYFTSIYAEDVFAKFRMLSSEEIGGMVCQRAIYGTIPTNMDLFAELSNPEVPPQFFGHVEESAYSTVGTPTSHYKVYYHIYAGEEKGIYYKIYLSSPITSAFSGTTPLAQYPIDAGYLEKSGMIDRTPDFIAPAGYRQLCIEIDGVPYCGFGWVSSEAAIKELTDMYSKSLATSNIKNEEECMFSSPALVGSIAGPAVEGTNLLARRGINRICSSGDPNAGIGQRVWDAVGWCDQKSGIKCWLDTSSVKGAITDLKIEYDIINASKSVTQLLQQGYQTDEEVKKKLDEAYQKYQNGVNNNIDYNNAITIAEKIIKESAPTQYSLLDEARFIMGLSYEQLFIIEKKKIEFQKLLKAGKASTFNVYCPSYYLKSTISDVINRNGWATAPVWSGYDPNLVVQAIISLESSGKANEISPSGAIGLMQLMPLTVKDCGMSEADALTQDKNIECGIKTLIAKYEQFGKGKQDGLKFALAGYIGIGNVRPAELRDIPNWEAALAAKLNWGIGDVYHSTGPIYVEKILGTSGTYEKCRAYDRIQTLSLVSTNKICDIAKLYRDNKIEVTRDGLADNTCARFVSEVLSYSGYSIKPGDDDYDSVKGLEKWILGQPNVAPIIYDNLQCGDIIIVTSNESSSGFHTGIVESLFGDIVNIIADPGINQPVQTRAFAKSKFQAAYRLSGTGIISSITQTQISEYTLLYNSTGIETLDSLADKFYGGSAYSLAKKTDDKERIKNANLGKISFKANDIIAIKMDAFEFAAFSKRYSFSNQIGCSAPISKKCDFGMKLTGSGSEYKVEGGVECYYYITPSTSEMLGEQYCSPCSGATICSDFDYDSAKCLSAACFSQSKIKSSAVQYCTYDTSNSKCKPYGIAEFVADLNKKAEDPNTNSTEKIKIYKEIINTLPNSQYSKDAINKAFAIAESTTNYFLLSEYASDSWTYRDQYVHAIGVKANKKDVNLKLALPLFNYYNATVKACLDKAPTIHNFCRCEINSAQFQTFGKLEGYDILLVKRNGGSVNLQLWDVTSAGSVVLASQPMQFAPVCFFMNQFTAAGWTEKGDSLFNTITTISTPRDNDQISLKASQHLFKLRDTICVYPHNFMNADYSKLEQCYP